jgi:hypothetical protein
MIQGAADTVGSTVGGAVNAWEDSKKKEGHFLRVFKEFTNGLSQAGLDNKDVSALVRQAATLKDDPKGDEKLLNCAASLDYWAKNGGKQARVPVPTLSDTFSEVQKRVDEGKKTFQGKQATLAEGQTALGGMPTAPSGQAVTESPIGLGAQPPAPAAGTTIPPTTSLQPKGALSGLQTGGAPMQDTVVGALAGQDVTHPSPGSNAAQMMLNLADKPTALSGMQAGPQAAGTPITPTQSTPPSPAASTPPAAPPEKTLDEQLKEHEKMLENNLSAAIKYVNAHPDADTGTVKEALKALNEFRKDHNTHKEILIQNAQKEASAMDRTKAEIESREKIAGMKGTRGVGGGLGANTYALNPEQYKALNNAIINGRLRPSQVNSRTAKIFADLELQSPGRDWTALDAGPGAEMMATRHSAMLQDTKVTTANSAMVLLNHVIDPKTGKISNMKSITPQFASELALNAARLVSPTGQVGIELQREFKQNTAAENLSKTLAYFGLLSAGTTEQNLINIRNFIQREGKLAQKTRDKYYEGAGKSVGFDSPELTGGQGGQESKVVNGVTYVKGSDGLWHKQQ